MPEIIDQSLNTTHITSNINQYEAARSNFFVFQVAPDQLTNLVHPDFDTSTGEPNSADLYDGQLVSDYLRLNVVSVEPSWKTLKQSPCKPNRALSIIVRTVV